ncbi:hypothetical protein Tco_0624199 [Tanacetum coccineum]|uniref:CCHC-type domain-containing protein n=1 Tax=Tanacetum coccineum TaxID=301880 RepID=A0ABQ4WD59_9ASTR
MQNATKNGVSNVSATSKDGLNEEHMEFDHKNYLRSGGDPIQDDIERDDKVEVVFDESVNLASKGITFLKTEEDQCWNSEIDLDLVALDSHLEVMDSLPDYTASNELVHYEDEYQRELQGDSQEDKLTTAMMLLARAITQKFYTPTNNRLCTSSTTRNQAVIQDGRVDIQTQNAGYGGNGNKNAGRQSRNQAFNARNGNDDNNQIIQRVPRTESTLGKENVQYYKCNEKGHYACDC